MPPITNTAVAVHPYIGSAEKCVLFAHYVTFSLSGLILSQTCITFSYTKKCLPLFFISAMKFS